MDQSEFESIVKLLIKEHKSDYLEIRRFGDELALNLNDEDLLAMDNMGDDLSFSTKTAFFRKREDERKKALADSER